jgi:hypothetical protein
VAWKIYYPEGLTFSDKDGDPFHAPQNNVQVVNNNGKIQSGKDAYYWNPDLGGWNGCDLDGYWDYMKMYVGPKAVLFGRTIRDEDYWEIRKRAKIEARNH